METKNALVVNLVTMPAPTTRHAPPAVPEAIQIKILASRAKSVKLGKSVQVVKTSVTNAKLDITPTLKSPVVSHVPLESIQIRVIKPQRVLVFLVKLVPIPRLLAQVVLIFVMHANQVGILTQHRILLGVSNAQKGTCKVLQALFRVNLWVPMPFDWVVVRQKS